MSESHSNRLHDSEGMLEKVCFEMKFELEVGVSAKEKGPGLLREQEILSQRRVAADKD